MNFTVEFSVDIVRLWVRISINLPDSENDQKYGNEFFKTSIDVPKLIRGIYGNYFTKSFMVNFLKSIDFELKYPKKKARWKLESECENI